MIHMASFLVGDKPFESCPESQEYEHFRAAVCSLLVTQCFVCDVSRQTF
jgi:hypothetical protein